MKQKISSPFAKLSGLRGFFILKSLSTLNLFIHGPNSIQISKFESHLFSHFITSLILFLLSFSLCTNHHSIPFHGRRFEGKEWRSNAHHDTKGKNSKLIFIFGFSNRSVLFLQCSALFLQSDMILFFTLIIFFSCSIRNCCSWIWGWICGIRYVN